MSDKSFTFWIDLITFLMLVLLPINLYFTFYLGFLKSVDITLWSNGFSAIVNVVVIAALYYYMNNTHLKNSYNGVMQK